MSTEQRSEQRVDVDVRFFVHVHESEQDPDMVGQSLQCEAIDFSAHGIQFSTNAELSTSTRLNITIGIGEPFAMYLLRGEVRWVRQKEDTYLMGVLLIAAQDTDLQSWLEVFDTQFNQQTG